MHYDALILGIILVLVLWTMHRKARESIRLDRKKTFDKCETLFTEINIEQDDVNFPVLTAQYKGLDVRIEPLADHIVVRKIPSLWLLLTIKKQLPYKSAMDFLVRPQNTEFYSPSASFHTILDIPEDWPQHAVLKTSDSSDLPPIEIVGRYIKQIFEDEKSKELLITSNGVRIVYQADQALRSHYMVLRQLIFENFRLEPVLVKHLLDTMLDLLSDLSNYHKPDTVNTGEA